jgi:hypothetical protein
MGILLPLIHLFINHSFVSKLLGISIRIHLPIYGLKDC